MQPLRHGAVGVISPFCMRAVTRPVPAEWPSLLCQRFSVTVSAALPRLSYARIHAAFQEPCVPRLPHVDAVDQCHRQSWLEAQLAARVTVVWTNNCVSMLSAKSHAPTGYHVRLHRMFHQAPDTVWQALVAYIRHANTAARKTLHGYIQRHQHLIRQPSQRRRPSWSLQSRGHCFDLESIYHELNQTYFANRVEARITWSRRPPQRARTSIRFGSYHARERLIRIHRLLDQPFVPRYVVENVVFHEMLHQLIPCQRVNGRWYVHSPEFRRQEQRFQYHRQAEQWKRRHLARLLRG